MLILKLCVTKRFWFIHVCYIHGISYVNYSQKHIINPRLFFFIFLLFSGHVKSERPGRMVLIFSKAKDGLFSINILSQFSAPSPSENFLTFAGFRSRMCIFSPCFFFMRSSNLARTGEWSEIAEIITSAHLVATWRDETNMLSITVTECLVTLVGTVTAKCRIVRWH